LAETRGPGYRIRKLVVETDPGILLPALVLVPDWPDEKAPTVVKLGADRAAELASGGDAATLSRQGRRVVLADLRGQGETAPASGSERREPPLGHDVKEAFLSLHLARPLLGQQTQDLLILLKSLQACRESPHEAGFEITGTGPSALAVLHAAALDESGQIRKVTMERSLCSWSDVLRSGVSRRQLASVVPGVLKYYDLPDLAARLEPCPLAIQAPVDSVGQPVTQEQLERTYARCLQSYGSTGTLSLHARP
jgi:hypothetical protein